MGWIKEKRKFKGSCGYTFEMLLKKEEDNFPVPDYHNIEIKTKNDNAKTNLHLFNLTPDGDYLYPIERLIKTIGYVKNKNNRVFFGTVNGLNYTKLLFGRKAIIRVNYAEEKVLLEVVDHHDENINIGISWSFNYLKERLLLKLKYLALVKASSCIICGEGYYHYHDISFYKLKKFDIFLHLIEQGVIEVSFNIGTHKSGKQIGMVYDHGTNFSIKISNLELLFDKVNV